MMSHLDTLWQSLEIRILVMASLIIQVLLLLISSFRKRVVSIRFSDTVDGDWRGIWAHMFHWLLWFLYLVADYVATVGLAYLRESNNKEKDEKTRHLIVFWAPFFLLHLGGQDTITALSIEDNELWSRHLLTLVSQATLAFYNYIMINRQGAGALWPAAALMFLVGCFKYIERTWALQRASMSALRSSMITKPDPGPNYAKFIQEYKSSIAAGLAAFIQIEPEKHIEENIRPIEVPPKQKQEYKELVKKAYEFFPIFKRLFVDLMLSYKNREDSQKYFKELRPDDAYQLIEVELSWMYDMLHSKASVMYTIKYYGWISRMITLFITSVALSLFATSNHDGYDLSDKVLTYVLLIAAVCMELVAFGYMFLSLWTYAAMKDCGFHDGIAEFLFDFQLRFRPRTKPKWSNQMAQFSLIEYSLVDKPRWWKSVIKVVGFKSTWDNYRYTTCVEVSTQLTDLVCEELQRKMDNIGGREGYRRCTDHRGQWALQRKGYYKEYGWSVEAEFDESIILWHIATDLLFNDELIDIPDMGNSDRRAISQNISNYLMFLLIGRPFMMPAGIGQIRFGDSSAEAKNFLQSQDDIKKDLKRGVKMILDVSTEYDPADIKGDRSKSLLFSGSKLAHELKEEFKGENNLKRMWNLISVVWVEMLCFASSKCSGQFHARQLSKGGELLTVVWFLMAHLGMGEQYRIEQGHARAKLIVSK